MFVREVVTGQKEGRPVRYAQIVSSYRNSQGKPRHKVVLSLGRVDRLDRDQLRGLVRALVRYLGQQESLLRPRVGEVREVGLPWVVHATWKRLALSEHLGHEARRHGLSVSSERGLFARVLGLVASDGFSDGGRSWLATEAFARTPGGDPIPVDPDGEDLLAQAGPDIERGLFLRRVISDGRVFAATLPIVAGYPLCAVACDAKGFAVASQVARAAPLLGRRLHRRLRDMGAREVVWEAVDTPAEVQATLDRIHRMLTRLPAPVDGGLERARVQLTTVLLAALVIRQLELDADLPMEMVREQLRTLRAAELRDGDRVRWEATQPSSGAESLLRRIGLGELPRTLPDPR